MTSQNRRPTMKDNQAKYPQLRFKGFTDPWEQRKLGEIFLERKSRSSDGELISVTIKTGVVKANDLNRRDNSSFDKSNYKTVQKGDIAYNSMRMWQGASGYSPFNGILSPAYTVLKPKSYDVNSEFFAYMFKKKPMLQCFQRSSQGLTSDTWNLKYPALSSIQVKVPSVEEQIKIAGLFKKVDHLIALHQRKLAMLKELKQGYLQKLFPQNGSKFPQLRFSGFADAWEERKFDECFNFPVSANSLSRALLNYDEGDIQSVHYGDILIKYPAILNVKNDKIPYITDSSFEKYKSNLLENGDLIFADAAEDETVGKAVEVNGLTEENLVAGLHTIVARSKDKKAEFFLGYYINSNTYHRQLLRLIQGSKVSSISKGNLQKTLVSFPKDFEEQQKIGAFFKKIDDTLALHQRKLEKLQELKKGYLQKMFC